MHHIQLTRPCYSHQFLDPCSIHSHQVQTVKSGLRVTSSSFTGEIQINHMVTYPLGSGHHMTILSPAPNVFSFNYAAGTYIHNCCFVFQPALKTLIFKMSWFHDFKQQWATSRYFWQQTLFSVSVSVLAPLCPPVLLVSSHYKKVLLQMQLPWSLSFMSNVGHIQQLLFANLSLKKINRTRTAQETTTDWTEFEKARK